MMMRLALLCLAVLAMTVLPSTEAFVTKQSVSFTRNSATLEMTIMTYKGKKKNFPAGSPLSKACAGLGVPVKYSCKKYVIVEQTVIDPVVDTYRRV
jgi:hypothetical protein